MRGNLAVKGASALRSAAGFMSALLMAGCGTWTEGIAPLPRDHPLVGRIWDVRTQRAISYEDLLQRATVAHYVLLGETHDNPEHHRIQADIMRALVGRGLRPALAMEQFDIDRQTDLERALVGPETSAEAIADAGGFDRKGWNWSSYRPLVEIARQAKLPIVAINLPRPTAREVAAEGLHRLGEARFARLALASTWNARRNAAMEREIVAGHCGHVTTDLLPRLVHAQRARDATMADALLLNPATGAIAIVGRQHARTDIGVPIYLLQRAPTVSVLSIGLVEAEEGRYRVADYSEAQQDTAAHDIVWLTPAAQRADPCKDFAFPRQEMKRAPTRRRLTHF